MAYICNKGIPCASCGHYRIDEDENRMACFAQQDEKQFKYFYYLKDHNTFLRIRPWEKGEWQYYYGQRHDYIARAGQIGRLRLDFGRNGDEFWSTWEDCESNRAAKTQAFKDVFDAIINLLRKNEGPLANFSSMRSACNTLDALHLRDNESESYGFRIEVRTPADAENYTLFVRMIPRKGDYNGYVFCYRAEALKQWREKTSKGIRFITPTYDGLFRIPDGGKVMLRFNDGRSPAVYACLFLDEYHFAMGTQVYHICEFAEICERNGTTVSPVTEEDMEGDAV